jgi:hypothetical protein
MKIHRLIQRRVAYCQTVLARYSDDDEFINLVDLLADAMHWCDANSLGFHYSLCVACKHYLAELNNEQTEERRHP